MILYTHTDKCNTRQNSEKTVQTLGNWSKAEEKLRITNSWKIYYSFREVKMGTLSFLVFFFFCLMLFYSLSPPTLSGDLLIQQLGAFCINLVNSAASKCGLNLCRMTTQSFAGRSGECSKKQMEENNIFHSLKLCSWLQCLVAELELYQISEIRET